MPPDTDSLRDIACALLWKLSRMHGWSGEVAVPRLARDAPVRDEERARNVARNLLPTESFVGYHRGRDTIWLAAPPGDELFHHLRDECGYSGIQIEATFSSYFDGF